MVEPLCPECRKKMAAHWTCDHCGFDPNRTKSKKRLVVLPYKCVRCEKTTQKKIDDIPVCGDCFTEGWGRLPDMPLSPPINTVTHEVGTIPDNMVLTTTAITTDDYVVVDENPPETPGSRVAKEIDRKIMALDESPKETKTYKCPECSVKPFKSKQRLNKHKTKIHGG